MQTKAANDVYQYWSSLRGRRRVPDRSDIQPAQIRHILPDLFILERAANGEIRFRLAGTRICTLFARELRGSRFDAMWSASQTNRLHRAAQDTMAQGLPLTLRAKAITGRSETLDTELVLLPLTSGEGPIDRILGALSTHARPLWLDADPVNYLQLETLSPLDIEAAGNNAEEDALFSPTANDENRFSQTLRRVMHLRVLEGGRRD